MYIIRNLKEENYNKINVYLSLCKPRRRMLVWRLALVILNFITMCNGMVGVHVLTALLTGKSPR
jgi:hypothetical protein